MLCFSDVLTTYSSYIGSVLCYSDVGCFRGLWKAIIPQVTSVKPRTDLCWQCHKNNYQLSRSLALSQRERELYQEMTAACKKICEEWQLSLGPSTPASKAITMHYSFDFAQQLKKYSISASLLFVDFVDVIGMCYDIDFNVYIFFSISPSLSGALPIFRSSG